MKWIWKLLGDRVHVRVYVNGAFAGRLCFSDQEFQQLMKWPNNGLISFEHEDS